MRVLDIRLNYRILTLVTDPMIYIRSIISLIEPISPRCLCGKVSSSGTISGTKCSSQQVAISQPQPLSVQWDKSVFNQLCFPLTIRSRAYRMPVRSGMKICL
jgi:hypothetical protein